MEDKKSHIDSFLEEKLKTLEASPDKQAWQAIASQIEHLAHPIDLSINNSLSDLSDDSLNNDPGVLANALEAHPIDLNLREKLGVLEAMPDHTAMAPILAGGNRTRRKRRAVILWLGGLVVAISAGILLRESHETYQQVNVPATTSQAGSDNAGKLRTIPHKDVQNKSGKSSSENPSGRKNRIYTTKYNKIRHNIPLNGAVSTSQNLSFEDMAIQDETSLDLTRSFPDFSQLYSPGSESVVPLKASMRVIPTHRLSPFSLHFQVGYLNQTSLGDRQEAKNIHKDATNNFEKASGHAMNGSLYSLQAAWSFRRFSLRCGLQYSTSTVVSHFDYVYYQLPLYDSMGNLADYIIRPYSQSPHISEDVKTSSTSVSVPTQLYMRLGHIGRIGLWGGIGSDLVLSRKVSGRLFSYDDEAMKDYKTTNRFSLSPHVSLMGQYRIAAGLALTANMQYAYSTQHISFEHAKYTRQQFLPSLRLGLLYTPTVRIK